MMMVVLGGGGGQLVVPWQHVRVFCIAYAAANRRQVVARRIYRLLVIVFGRRVGHMMVGATAGRAVRRRV